MAKRCIICKKELSDDNDGFLCQYHKDKSAELAKKTTTFVTLVVATASTAGKYVYEHREEILDAGKKVITTATDIVKKNL